MQLANLAPPVATAPRLAAGPAAGEDHQPPFRYHLYGMTVGASRDILGAFAPAAGTPSELTIEWASIATPPPTPEGALIHESRCDGPCHGGGVYFRVHRGPLGAWLWHDGVAFCQVSADARRVTVYPQTGADDRAVAMMLAGPVAVYVLHQLGIPTLHASAAVCCSGAAVFLGQPGQGKSSMCAGFLRRGHALLTDDVLPLRAGAGGVVGVPGPRLMKVWPETARGSLGIHEPLPNMTAALDKKMLLMHGRYAVAEAPVPLRRIYLLRRYDPGTAGRNEIVLHPLTQREAVATLVGHTARGELLLPVEAARLLPAYALVARQAPVRVLAYPNGFAYQDAVRERILADMAGA